LPSAQSTPQSPDVPGLEPAAPPSAANLASTGTKPAAPTVTIPPSTAATINNAPQADYSAGNPLVEKLVSTPAKAGTTAMPGAATPFDVQTTPPLASAAPAATPGPLPTASVPAAGPYDPNAYQPASQLGAAASPLASAGSPAAGSMSTTAASPYGGPADRYATAGSTTGASAAMTTDTMSPPTSAQSPMTSSAPAATADRYALAADPASSYQPSAQPSRAATTPVGDRYGVYTASEPSMAAASAPAAPLANTSQSTTPTAAPAPGNATTVRISAAPGQYRPGGTSSYTATAKSPVEVATRPGAPTAAPSSTPATQPGQSSAPWSPPTSSAGSSGRMY
jgi:ribonuclease E